MRFEIMANKEQFEQLEKGDLILVKWSDYWVKHNQGSQKVKLYKIYENKSSHNEIICQRRYNHYFNYEMYIEVNSVAEEVYKVIQ